MKKINVAKTNVTILNKKDGRYISLTDIAKHKNTNHPRYVVQNWMKTKYTVEFLGIWEQIHNSNFNRVEFDTFKNMAGSNSFVLTPKKWLQKTNAIGLQSKSGRYGGTFAHKDIAFEFASWISAEFIRQGLAQGNRLRRLNQIAIIQMSSLLGATTNASVQMK